jgi:maltooligosyltrehalose trehalohydrolase
MTAPDPARRCFARTWGAELIEGGARFRLWAPGQRAVLLRLDAGDREMVRDPEGWFEVVVPEAAAGAEYSFVLEDGMVVPDPAARAQAGDVHGPSKLIDPRSYRWRQADWPGRPWEQAVISELHVGTFTPEGTFRAAMGRLQHLADLGVTAIELMPVAQFAGDRGWGYDGVLPYAPHRAYGTPDDMKALVDAAHGAGLMVLLDVVYNHFGPDGNYLHAYAQDFFHPEQHTPWGPAIAYDREPVRRFFVENALYWLEEFHLDGLRLDAVDQVRDPDSPVELLVEIAERVRAAHALRHVHLTTEDNRNITRLHERGPDGAPRLYTAEWNDDFHNVAHVIATGETEGYYEDFADDVWGKLARALAEGFAYQGEPSRHAGGEARGEPSGHLPPTAFVDFLQNHDQTGNRALGERLVTLTRPELAQALAAILLLSPHVPLLFMGEEWGETRPFAFFTDFHGELADAVREGRRREFRHFAAFEDEATRATIPDPNAPETFEASRIDWGARDTAAGRAWLELTRTLLATRHREIVPRLAETGGGCGRVLVAADGVVAVDWRLSNATLRLRANLGQRAAPAPAAEGRVLYAAAGADWAELPPLSVLVTLDATDTTA